MTLSTIPVCLFPTQSDPRPLAFYCLLWGRCDGFISPSQGGWLEEDGLRRRDGSGRAGGLLACGENCSTQWDYTLCHLEQSPCRTSTAGTGFTDDHCVQMPAGQTLRPVLETKEGWETVRCFVRVMFPCSPASTQRLSLVRLFNVKEH